MVNIKFIKVLVNKSAWIYQKNHKRGYYIYGLGNITSKLFSLFGLWLVKWCFCTLVDIFPVLKFLYCEKLLFNEYGVSLWEDEKVQEMDSGDVCLTMWMYLMLLSVCI